MPNTRYARPLIRMLALLSAVALFFALSAGIPSAHAQTNQRTIPRVDSSQCKRLHTSTHDVFCAGPSIVSFCGKGQYTTFTDGHGNLSDTTKLDHFHHCLTVTFSLTSSFSSCTIEFYVPQGNANALFTYSWFDGATHTGTLNEAPVDGWQFLFTAANATSLSFEDFQPNSPPSPPQGPWQIGWGASSTDGVRVTCG